jgi:anthranilate synthase component 1
MMNEPQGFTHLALTRELPGDLDTAVGTYLKLANRPYSFLLESVQGGERWARYSFIGLPCHEILSVRGREVRLSRDGAVVEQATVADPIAWLRGYAARTRVRPEAGLPRFSGGLVGYFGYDCVRYFEPKLAADKADPLGTPDILLMRADELAIFDNLRATLTLVVHARIDDPIDQARARARLDAIEAELAEPLPRPAPRAGAPEAPQFSSGFSHDGFCAAVEKIKQYIAAGDCMQVVPSQRLSAPFHADAVALYRAIRRLNPSPYLYCMHLGDHQVVGSSPEILVRVEDGLMTVRPIAGTRKRGATAEADEALAAELLADPKEIAEHLMLIDLGRNDVGRVTRTGEVKLTERMVIERYSHVMHIVSNVTGRLKPGLDALDALAAAFPAGTLSGAPKVRAMQIIEEVEPVKRGIYGGAIGYLGWDGNMDTAIAIRTAVIKDGLLHVQAGAGIVADSVPESEWEETMSKARAMMKAAALATAAQAPGA